MVQQQVSVDSTARFQQLWDITQELRQKLEARFSFQPNEATKDLATYSAQVGAAHGSLNTFSGTEIDWLVHSWMREPNLSFCNMHLTIWLGSQIRIPHLAFAFATVPHLFFYMDYVSRSDLLTDLDYLDRYYQPANERYLAFVNDDRFQQYIGKTLYIRQVQSQTSLCFTSTLTDETIAVLRSTAHEMIDRWLSWVDEAEPVPESQRAALAQRDLIVRRAIAERDPDNAIAIRLFGEEMTDKLVRSLWGGI